MANIADMAQHFIGAATANPEQKHAICHQAAQAFMNAAENPRNASNAKSLTEMGLAFARAAQSARPPVIEDFADLLHETAAAYEAAGPWGDDPMDLVSIRREIHDQRTVLAPGETFITPPSFNKDVTLGRTTQIKWQPTQDEIKNGIQQVQTVAFWQGVKKEAQAMTVDSSLGFLPNIQSSAGEGVAFSAFANVNNRAFVEVEFGSDGNRNKVQYDLRLGQRCTVVGNYVSVLIGAEQPGFGFAPQILEVGASIGAFAAPSLAPLIRTIYIDGLGGPIPQPMGTLTRTGWLPIPLKAAALLPIQTDLPLTLAGERLSIVFADAGGNELTQITYQQGPLVPQQIIPLYGDVAYVAVKTLSTFVTNVRLPFQLSL